MLLCLLLISHFLHVRVRMLPSKAVKYPGTIIQNTKIKCCAVEDQIHLLIIHIDLASKYEKGIFGALISIYLSAVRIDGLLVSPCKAHKPYRPSDYWLTAQNSERLSLHRKSGSRQTVHSYKP